MGGFVMLAKLFGSRSSRRTGPDHCFRPELEHLEGRLAPSSGNGHGHEDSQGQQGNQPPVIVNPPGNEHNNVHNNVHITATNSFNTTINNTITITNNITNSFNRTSMLAPPQQTSVQMLNALSSLLATEMGNSQLGSLLNDEIALAVDTYLLPFASKLGITTLKGDINTLQSAINANPLESTPVGQMIGMLAFDVTTTALTSAQPTV
jgi:hypothetical protein